MVDLVSSIYDLLYDLRERFMDSHELRPFWLYSAIIWCNDWLEAYSDIEE